MPRLLRRLMGDRTPPPPATPFASPLASLPPSPRDVEQWDKWQIAQTGKAVNIITDDTRCTATYMKLTNEDVNLALQQRCGCTGLVIFDNTGVYAAHYFKNPAFLNEDNFRKQVIRGLYSGMKGQRPLKGRFQANTGAHAWLIIPASGDEPWDLDPYRPQWDWIASTVKDLVRGVTFHESKYNPLDQGIAVDCEILDSSARGRMLFKYDSRSGRKYLWSEYKQLFP
ncbi:MAG: hypothetical protein M1818_000273 [Claussenomyces sp. TS43310]|nr:MAG: hypothetical protein M1818_000273 [Claussenomyces sp. TS43310]